MKKNVIGVLLSMVLVVSLAVGCKLGEVVNEKEETTETTKESVDEEFTVGVLMPTRDMQRWRQDGANIKEQLEATGYKVNIKYAKNDIATQVTQIETMVSAGVDILVIASIDGESLGEPLEAAKEADIPVIAYDRLIMNTDAVDYYATFDNYDIGQKQGEYIEEALGLADADGATFNIEIFAGDAGDNNSKFYYHGAMDVLRKYIDAGILTVLSGEVDFEEVLTSDWSTEKAQNRMETILSSHYVDGTNLDAVLCSNDSIALGVANALEKEYMGNYPVITGQDCDVVNVKNLLEEKQAMDIFKDTRTLAEQVVKMVDAILSGGEVPINDIETYDNGTGVIPTFLCETVTTTIDNYVEILIDSGYYTELELQ